MHLARSRHLHIRQLFQQNVPHAILVVGVGIGIREADGHGLDATLANHIGNGARLDLVNRRQDITGVVDSLLDHETITATDVRWRDLLVRVPQVIAVTATNFDDIAKSFRGDHCCAGKLACDQCVCCDRRAVREQRHVFPVNSGGSNTLEDTIHWVGCRWCLRDMCMSISIKHEDVGECATDVHGNTNSVVGFFSTH